MKYPFFTRPRPEKRSEPIMDFFEQIAREQVRAMILNHARREDLSQIFSQGEMRLLGCLNAGADGRTAGELSTLLDLSTARIAAMLNNLERKGAITRARDTADRRRVVVRLTGTRCRRRATRQSRACRRSTAAWARRTRASCCA